MLRANQIMHTHTYKCVCLEICPRSFKGASQKGKGRFGNRMQQDCFPEREPTIDGPEEARYYVYIMYFESGKQRLPVLGVRWQVDDKGFEETFDIFAQQLVSKFAELLAWRQSGGELSNNPSIYIFHDKPVRNIFLIFFVHHPSRGIHTQE